MNVTVNVERIAGRTLRTRGALLLSALMVLSTFALLGGASAASIAPAPSAIGGHAASTHAGVAFHGLPSRFGESFPLRAFNPFSLASLMGPSGGLPSNLPTAARILQHAGVTPSQSTTSNFDIGGSSCSRGATVVQAGTSNQTLEAGTTSWWTLFTGTGGVPCNLNYVAINGTFWTHGATPAYHSTDGGMTWSEVAVNGNVTHWQNPTDPTYGSVSWGNPIMAGGTNGTVLYSSEYFQACSVVGGSCNSTMGNIAPDGIAVAKSTNGGLSFGVDQQIYASLPDMNYSIPSVCNAGNYLVLQRNITENPTIAYDQPTNRAIVAWDMLRLAINYNSTPCSLAVFNTSILYAVSTNGGTTWGPVHQLATDGGLETPAVGFAGAPANTAYIVADDFGSRNATVQQDGNLQMAFATFSSANGGTTWTSAVDTSSASVNFVTSAGSYPDKFFVMTQPMLAVDNWSGDAHQNWQYVVSSDNQTGTYAGFPGIAFISKSPTGAWSSPTMLTSGTKSVVYLTPSISVAPGGAIWVTYLGVNTLSGNYREYGIESANGGLTWSSQFVISDSDSLPTDQGYIGQTTGLVATTNGAYPMWTDCRGSCSNGDPYAEMFTANVHMVSLTANISGVNATVSTFGQNSVLALPATQGWDTGSNHTIQVPVWVPGSNTSYVNSFSSYSGLSTSTNFLTTFTYNGNGGIQANYHPVPASWIRGVFTPAVTGAKLKLDNQYPVPLTSGGPGGADTYNFTVASGQTYTLSAFAPKYVPLTSNPIPTTAHQQTWYNISLQRYTGVIAGHVSPTNATVTLNGTTQTIPSNGIYNLNVPWGWYWLNASQGGYTQVSYQVVVNPNVTSTQNLVLSGGWIWGAVLNPAHLSGSFRLAIDGVQQTLANGNTFNASVRGGLHILTATQPGYNLTIIRNIVVVPGHATLVNVNITNKGWIEGSISPPAAVAHAILKIANATAGSSGVNFYPITPSTGAFNVTLIGNYNYTVNVTATGYLPFQAVVQVTPGNLSSYGSGNLVVIDLKPSQVTPPDCHLNNSCPNNGNGGGKNTSGSGLTTTELLLIVLVIVVVAAVIGAVAFMRRGGGGASSAPAESSDNVYQESNPDDLPKLQSDGTMESGENPPGQ